MNNEATVIAPDEQETENPTQEQERDFSQIPEIEVDEDISQYMEREDLLDVKITPVGAQIVGANGRVKNISLKSLAKAIFDDAGIDTGYMPIIGSDYYGIRRYLQHGDKHIILMEASPSVRSVRYDVNYLHDSMTSRLIDNDIPVSEDRRFYTFRVPQPYVILGLSGKENAEGDIVYHTSKLLASKVPVFSDTTQLYKYPFGNIYDDYKVCWGEMEHSIRTRKFKNIMQFGGVIQEFFDNIYNEDLYNYANAHQNRCLSENLLDLHLNHSTYPSDSLKEANKVSEIISMFKNN